VQATGMGQPSTAIYVHELIKIYNVRTLIRVGTCGGLNTSVKVRDVVIGASAATDSTIVKDAFGAYNYAPAADFSLLRAADDTARAKGKTVHVGGIVSSDIFYHPSGIEAYAQLIEHGVLGVEMEAATLYTLAARFNARALAICTMTDCLITGEEIDAEARQSSLVDMVEIALDVAINA
jgi:purine-nucleoside phosphorylase